MKTHIVLTPANIEIEYRLAGAGSRLAAFVIDFALQIFFCLLLSVVILFVLYDYRIETMAAIEGPALAFLIISWFLVYFCYFIVCEMSMNGQSIGKKLFGLRVIRDNGQPIELQQCLIRNLFRAVLDILYVGLFFILFSPKHKRIGDMVAGTVVIAEHYEGTIFSQAHTPAPRSNLNLNIYGMEKLILSPKERELLNSYIARKIYLPDGGRHLQKQWAAYLSEKWQIDDALIDDALLAALLEINESKY
jgi:uncharacterized RDD family membrane protein YckC